MLTYETLVRSEDQTCFACPVLYEGVTVHGDSFYFRLRHGSARLVFNEGESYERRASMNAINGLDGVCSYEEYKKMFMMLFRRLA